MRYPSLLFSFVLLLAACGGGDPEAEAALDDPEATTELVRERSRVGELPSESGEIRAAQLEQLIEKRKKEHVEIVNESQASLAVAGLSGDDYDRAAESMRKKVLADNWALYGGWLLDNGYTEDEVSAAFERHVDPDEYEPGNYKTREVRVAELVDKFYKSRLYRRLVSNSRRATTEKQRSHERQRLKSWFWSKLQDKGLTEAEIEDAWLARPDGRKNERRSSSPQTPSANDKAEAALADSDPGSAVVDLFENERFFGWVEDVHPETRSRLLPHLLKHRKKVQAERYESPTKLVLRRDWGNYRLWLLDNGFSNEEIKAAFKKHVDPDEFKP